MAECLAAHDGTRIVRGWEAGGSAPGGGSPIVRAPRSDESTLPAPIGGLREWAAALWERLVNELPLPPSEVAVLLSRAEAVESICGGPGSLLTLSRRVTYVRVLLGADPWCPRWTRAAPLLEDCAPLPDAWVDAAAREVSGWNPLLPQESNLLLDDRSAPVVVDVFAFADLLRTAAAGWLARGVRCGDIVASPSLAVDDPGFPFPAAGGDRDAEAQPVRPLVVIREGRLWNRPRSLADEARGLGRSMGSSVRESWRRPMTARWRSLVVHGGGEHPWPADALVLTRVLVLPNGALLGGGYRLEDGRPRARFGPLPAQDADWWMSRIDGLIGPRAPDGGGIPVEAPAGLVPAATV